MLNQYISIETLSGLDYRLVQVGAFTVKTDRVAQLEMNARRVMRVALALSVGVSLCVAAPKVDIRVVQRPRPEPPTPEVGPFPFRPPADPSGPFSAYADSVGCMTKFPAEINGKSVLIDICHLKNVTFIEVPPTLPNADSTTEQLSPKLSPEAGASVAEASASEESTSGSPPTEEKATPRREILGIFRGWKIDPIHKKFKYAVFDDGDLCGVHGTERFSVTVELVRSSQSDAIPRVYDVRQLSTCAFTLRVEAYVAEYELFASSGIHTPGVVDISDASEMLPQICGEMKCQYSHVTGRIEIVRQEIESLKKSLSEVATSTSSSVTEISVSAATSIIQASTNVMEKALEVLQSVEKLEQAAQDARKVAGETVSSAIIEDVTATS